MFGWIEICLLAGAGLLLVLRGLPYLRTYHPLFGGGGVLLLITAAFPRADNPIGGFLFGGRHALHLPRGMFGIAWWILGAWLLKSLLQLALRRTLFPDNNQPQSRRLFADLASGLIYVLAFFGIVGTVFDEPVSTFLATSGVMAIVLGLALQSTLGDVFSGLAINLERPFHTGDWISLPDNLIGEVMQVNWRATRLRTWLQEIVIVPNSVVTKAMLRNYSGYGEPHFEVIAIGVDIGVAPSRVIDTLQAAGLGAPEITPGTAPRAYARAFSDSVVNYDLVFAIDDFATVHAARSAMLRRVGDALRAADIPVGMPASDIRIVQGRELAPALRAPPQGAGAPAPRQSSGPR